MNRRADTTAAQPPLFAAAALLRLAEARLADDVPGATAEDLHILTDQAALQALCRAFAQQPLPLSFFGRKRAEFAIVDALLKRVALTRYQQRYPDIEEVSLHQPIVIVAPFRSGTTLVQRLLAQDPDTRSPRSWETFQPPPVEPDWRGSDKYFTQDARIAVTRRYLRGFERAHPQLAHLHPANPAVAEECFGLLETSLVSPSFMLHGAVGGYLDWLVERSDAHWDRAYKVYAQQLRLLHWWYPRPRWALKSPFHLYALDALLRQFPDAVVVQMHRDPADCMTSFCTLLASTYRSIGRGHPTLSAIGEMALKFMGDALSRSSLARVGSPARFVDIQYEQLMQAPMAAVEAIYAARGESPTPRAAGAMAHWLAAQPPRTSALTMARLSDFGLTSAQCRQVFEPYHAPCC